MTNGFNESLSKKNVYTSNEMDTLINDFNTSISPLTISVTPIIPSTYGFNDSKTKDEVYTKEESTTLFNDIENSLTPSNPSITIDDSGSTTAISMSTNVGNIYYTTDESTPTTLDTKYNGSFYPGKSVVLNAISYMKNRASGVSTEIVSVKPTISQTDNTISISNGGVGDIYYTTDNTTPTTSSTKYTDSWSISSECTVQAITSFRDKISTVQVKTFTPIKVGDEFNFNGNPCVVMYVDDGTAGYSFACTKNAEILYNGYTVVSNKGYEWGAFNITVGIGGSTQSSTGEYFKVGSGLSNSNTALANSACFTPYYEGQETIWKCLQNLRDITGSNNWFIPSLYELQLIYNNRASLDDIYTSSSDRETQGRSTWYKYDYRSSSEWSVDDPVGGSVYSWNQIFYNGNMFWNHKRDFYSCRFCRAFTYRRS